MKKIITVLLMVLHSSICLAQTEKPNIVIMMADDMGYGDLGCFGNKIIKTPNLDGLAKEGVRFSCFYSGHPTCSPSRAAMMAGRTPYRNGIYTYIGDKSCVFLREKEVTIGELCKMAGYDTGFFGKWGLIGNMEDKTQPFPDKHGFDFWYATHNNAKPSHKDPENFYENGKALGTVKGYSSQIVVDNAMKWLDNRSDKSKPFCLVLWFHEPHLVLAQPDSFRQKYAEYKSAKGEYYANVDHLDHQVGRFLSYLDKHKLQDNTWITFTSDNGPKKDAGGTTGGFKGNKSSFYEGGYREPTIMYWKGVLDGGKTIDTPLAFFDFVPTLYDLLKIKKQNDEPLDGVSMLPAFKGETPTRKNLPIWMGLNDTTLRKGDWKIIGKFPPLKMGNSYFNYLKTRKIKSFELYNLKDDPYEKRNMAKKVSERLQEMKALLNKRVEDVQKEMVPWNGKGVLPWSVVQKLINKGKKLSNNQWKTMSSEEQDCLGQKSKK